MSEYISKQEINRVLLNRIDMNSKCLSGARESKQFEEEKYFYTLILEDEQVKALIEESAPTADVRPNIHGHWIRHLRNDLGVKLNDCIECSECKTWFTTEELLRRSFCPNCGCCMKEEK